MALRPIALCSMASLALGQGEGLWSLRPVTRPAVPEVTDEAWPRSPVDRFVLARLEAAGLTPAPEADPRTLDRRAHLVLHGLPPEPGAPPRLFEEQVDELLASPH